MMFGQVFIQPLLGFSVAQKKIALDRPIAVGSAKVRLGYAARSHSGTSMADFLCGSPRFRMQALSGNSYNKRNSGKYQP
jgi:hypothetical protein